MQEAPSLDHVYGAVSALFNNHPNTEDKERASQWLGELQKSVYAWRIADQLLHAKKDVESCYFAAQTMRSKVQLHFHELPIESHNALRDSIMEHIGQINEHTNPVIVVQLCLALADLALQMTSWNSPVEDLFNKYGQQNMWALLEILIVLPEEVNTRQLRLGANRRAEVINNLMSQSKKILSFLEAYLAASSDNIGVQIKILKCFTSWLSIHAVSLPDLANNAILGHVFSILQNHMSPSNLHEVATDCLCALLQHLEDNNNNPDIEMELFNVVRGLDQPYHLSVAHESIEKSLNYCRIFTEFAEAMLSKILNGTSLGKPHFAAGILDLVLGCVGHHDYEVADITFNLWYRLSEDLYLKNDDDLSTMFKQYIERLIAGLCKHCQIEPDHEGLLDEVEDFCDFRGKVSELIKDVVFIVGSSHCFKQMFLHLQTPNITWDSTEAALFIMQAVAKNILPEENEVVPQVLAAILKLPESVHIMVRHTSIFLLGELCEWIERHPETLQPVLNYLLVCLQNPQLATVAARALHSICSACRLHMSVHIDGLLQIIEALDTFRISPDAAVGLIKGVSLIVSRLEPEKIAPAMKFICDCQVKPLIEIIKSEGTTIQKGTKTDPSFWLDRLAAIFRYTSPIIDNSNRQHPCLNVIKEVFVVLASTCSKYQSDLRTMERCCRCYRFAIRCVGKHGGELLGPLVQQMVQIYQLQKHSCFLYLGSILVDEYGSEEDIYLPILLEMLQAYVAPAFSLLQTTDGLRNNPDTVDDLFRLCNRFLQRAPAALLNCQMIECVVQCALMAISLDHREANNSVMRFFSDLIHSGKSNETKPDYIIRKEGINKILSVHGQTLVNNLLYASVFHLHTYMLNNVAEVMLEMQLWDRKTFGTWLQTSIQTLPFQNSTGVVIVTQKQFSDFYDTITRADTIKSIYHSLRDFIALYH